MSISVTEQVITVAEGDAGVTLTIAPATLIVSETMPGPQGPPGTPGIINSGPLASRPPSGTAEAELYATTDTDEFFIWLM